MIQRTLIDVTHSWPWGSQAPLHRHNIEQAYFKWKMDDGSYTTMA
jgi:hypothetical protein